VRRQLKPGGRLAFVAGKALADNPWAAIPLAVVARSLGIETASDPEAPGPFSFGSGDRVRRVVEGAGFVDVATTAFEHPFAFGENLDDAVEAAATMGPASRHMREASPEAQAAAREALRGELSSLAPAFALASSVWIVTARAARRD
jgi:hypothetical protein